MRDTSAAAELTRRRGRLRPVSLAYQAVNATVELAATPAECPCNGVQEMTGLTAMAVGAGAFALPLLGVLSLVASKITRGTAGAAAQRLFFATLLLATVATFRTMMAGESAWLGHSLTMAVMIIGAACVPAVGETARQPARRPA